MSDNKFKPTPEQEKIFKFIKKRPENLLIEAYAGGGKCLGIDTPILMYDGTIKKVQDVIPGDLLMGDDSKPRIVLNTNTGNGDLYEVIPQKGDSWVCNDVHILTHYSVHDGSLHDTPLDDLINHNYLNRNENGFYKGLLLQRNNVIDNVIYRTAFKTKYIGKGDYYGFTLDGNGRFLLGDFTITHNTTTLVEIMKLLPKDANILFLAFNKHIQEELKSKLPDHIRCYTSHGLGMSAIKRKYGDSIEFDEFKIDKIIKKESKKWDLHTEFDKMDQISRYLNSMKKMVNLCRLSLTLDKKYIPFMADRYDVKIDKNRDVKRIIKLLDIATRDRKYFDYTDMVYLPAVDKSLWLFPQDYVIVDECLPYKTYITTLWGKYQIGKLSEMKEKNKQLPNVITYNEQTKTFEYKEIEDVWCTGEKDVYQVTLDRVRKLKSTVNHKFLTTEGWKRLDELGVGDIVLGNDNREYKVTKEMVFLKKEKTYDMTIKDNHNFLVSNTGGIDTPSIIAHNCQDINRSQQRLIEKSIKKDKVTKKDKGKLIAVGDAHQCQPEGTKIMMHDGTTKNIEDVCVGDMVTSYNRKEKGHFTGYYIDHIKRYGYVTDYFKNRAPKINKIAKREYNGELVVIESKEKISKYTPNHRCIVSLRKDRIKRQVLYLMEKDGYFRIGITPLWKSTNTNFGSYRANQEKADKFWILNTYDEKFDAYLDEQYYSTVYSIPQICFWHRDQKGNINQKIIDNYYKRFDKDVMRSNALKLLNLFKREINYPIWYKGINTHFSKLHLFEINACNIIPEIMNTVHFDNSNVTIRTHGKKSNKIIRPTYIPIDNLTYEHYTGYVYSLEVSKYELYVADGILTHNSIYGFSAVTDRTFQWFKERPNTKTLPLSYSFRCAKKIIEHANEIVPEIKALPEAPEGVVRDGNVLEEAQDGDFVLCRTTMPLVQLFFQLLEQHKKAVIKGSDIGLDLIGLIGDNKNIISLKKHWKDELVKFQNKLKKEGILNYNEHSGYVAMEDKANTLIFLANQCNSINNLKDKIKTIFTDKLSGIILSTIHKAKGLEANRVFIIRPDLIPLPNQRSWQQKQEKNLEYVAITRARLELIYDREWHDENG
ncbi:MAG: 3'-5' exonuclease [bacterium]